MKGKSKISYWTEAKEKTLGRIIHISFMDEGNLDMFYVWES